MCILKRWNHVSRIIAIYEKKYFHQFKTLKCFFFFKKKNNLKHSVKWKKNSNFRCCVYIHSYDRDNRLQIVMNYLSYMMLNGVWACCLMARVLSQSFPQIKMPLNCATLCIPKNWSNASYSVNGIFQTHESWLA